MAGMFGGFSGLKPGGKINPTRGARNRVKPRGNMGGGPARTFRKASRY